MPPQTFFLSNILSFVHKYMPHFAYSFTPPSLSPSYTKHNSPGFSFLLLLLCPMASELEKPTITEIKVRMDCNGCVQKIKKALHGIKGINDLYLDYPNQKLTIIGRADPEKIVKAIRKTRKSATICLHREQQTENKTEQTEPSPETGHQQGPDGANPPQAEPESTAQPPDAAAPSPEPEVPPPEPPKEPPPAKKPAPESSTPASMENNAADPTNPSVQKDEGKAHVIHHYPPEYGHRYDYDYSGNGHWGRYNNSQGYPHEPPSRYTTRQAFPHEPPDHYAHSPRYPHETPPVRYVNRSQAFPNEPQVRYVNSQRFPHETPRVRYVDGSQAFPKEPQVGYFNNQGFPNETPPVRYVNGSQDVPHEPQVRHVNSQGFPHERPPVRHANGEGYAQELPQSVNVTHSYNKYRPSTYVTEYEYPRSPPCNTYHSRRDHYSEGYHTNSNSNGDGNITAIFSDENPNSCTVM